MKKHAKSMSGIVLFFVAVVVLAVAAADAEAIQTDIYSGYTECTGATKCFGGAPYFNYVGSIFSSDVCFATNTGYDWHPFGLASFGALITGYLSVASAGSFEFKLNSDDGSMLYIDGSLVVDNGEDNGRPSPLAASPLFRRGFTRLKSNSSRISVDKAAWISTCPRV